jgi:hypothetical protein
MISHSPRPDLAGEQQPRIAVGDHQQAAEHRQPDSGRFHRRHRRAKQQPVASRDDRRRQRDDQRAAAGFDHLQPVEETQVVEKDAAGTERASVSHSLNDQRGQPSWITTSVPRTSAASRKRQLATASGDASLTATRPAIHVAPQTKAVASSLK